MPFPKSKSKGGSKRATFGGKPKTASSPPDKKILESLGGVAPQLTGFEMRTPGNKETGFMQNTQKKATGAMMGRPPPLIGGLAGKKTSPRKDAKKQFKPKGRKVF